MGAQRNWFDAAEIQCIFPADHIPLTVVWSDSLTIVYLEERWVFMARQFDLVLSKGSYKQQSSPKAALLFVYPTNDYK